ncbi:MAG: DUF4417 domain-containing protein [Clostridia bacterium]|nr:DUF4417 domain-containing protein [Clostridia bacterium]
MSRNKNAVIDDGMCPELVKDADFDGYAGIPIIKKPEKIIIPTGIVPFSYRNRAEKTEAIGFHEMDEIFADVLRNPTAYDGGFAGKIIISPDCSLYRDAPYAVAVANTYRNRAIGYHYQTIGAYVIPQIRWGNSLTYRKDVFPDKLAFLGVEKHGIYAIGTYGCIQSKEDKRVFKEGLEEMLFELEPEVVLVYGSMPHSVFDDYRSTTRFVQYPDWTTRCHGGSSNG